MTNDEKLDKLRKLSNDLRDMLLPDPYDEREVSADAIVKKVAAALAEVEAGEAVEDADKPYQITLDRRDLFDFVRAAILDALENDENQLNQPRAGILGEAHDRTEKCLSKLFTTPQPSDFNAGIEAAVQALIDAHEALLHSEPKAKRYPEPVKRHKNAIQAASDAILALRKGVV